VAPAFRERFTVFAIDRRGRGESGALKEHALINQFEDVLAVIDAAGERVDLMGHSFGARCAMGATVLAPDRVKHLVLYEPPVIGDDVPDIVAYFENREPSDAVAGFMTDAVGMTAEQLAMVRATPFWDYLTGFAATMPTEIRALVDAPFDPESHRVLTMPVLFLVGSETRERLGEGMRQIEPYMPQARWHEFAGQGHGATLLAPKEFTDVVLEFLLTASK
jgi:pimeloyl-ACP methyl ester carboxylesterase